MVVVSRLLVKLPSLLHGLVRVTFQKLLSLVSHRLRSGSC